MKLFHLSDLHIGKRVNEFSMLEDQKYILMQILKAAKEHQPDGIILAGDIYDKPVPAAEAVQVFDDFLTSLNEMGLIVFMISRFFLTSRKTNGVSGDWPRCKAPSRVPRFGRRLRGFPFP